MPIFRGTPGNDFFGGASAGDTLDGGEGRDEFSYEGGDVTINLVEGTTSFGAKLVSIEDVWSDGGNDLLIGNDAENRLRGHLGSDTLEGAGGADLLEGEDGADSLIGGADGDTLTGGAGDDTLDGGDGLDVATFAGNAAGYAVSQGQDAIGFYTLVTDTDVGDGDEGTDRIYNVEGLSFADQTSPICFMPGTLIATPAGEAPVETLRRGDVVLTAGGRAAPVVWVGRQTVCRRFADPLRVLPVRIEAGSLGGGLPRRDLLVSADHALFLDGVLVQAGALVNGSTVRREADVPETWTYWHVELADHALVLAEGVAAESFLDNAERLAFDNWAEHEALHPRGRQIEEMPLPRAKSRRQVPQGLRQRLAALAGDARAPAA